MAFCWFTSFEGYPNFFKKTGHGADFARAFLTLADATNAGTPYSDSKERFPDLDSHQVETKKAAFQEFGLLYVVPHSDTLALTPLGQQVLQLCKDKQANRRGILLALAQGLARYQFDNPLPVGGNSAAKRQRACSSDVLPYLACFYLLHKLGGLLTVSELRGAIFGLQNMSDLRALEAAIRSRRNAGDIFPDIPAIPQVRKTADNLKIYFVSHLSLDGEIARPANSSGLYKGKDKVIELTQLGFEITESVLDAEWSSWRGATSRIPIRTRFPDIAAYFTQGVGRQCPPAVVQTDAERAAASNRAFRDVLDEYDAQLAKEFPLREYREGRERYVQHARLERTRNPALVRDAKRLFKKTHNRFFCEVCGFDFEIEYGKRGKDYIEAHHKTPFAELKQHVVLKIADLAMVCSNCHRMLHKPPWIAIEELRATLSPRP